MTCAPSVILRIGMAIAVFGIVVASLQWLTRMPGAHDIVVAPATHNMNEASQPILVVETPSAVSEAITDSTSETSQAILAVEAPRDARAATSANYVNDAVAVQRQSSNHILVIVLGCCAIQRRPILRRSLKTVTNQMVDVPGSRVDCLIFVYTFDMQRSEFPDCKLIYQKGVWLTYLNALPSDALHGMSHVLLLLDDILLDYTKKEAVLWDNPFPCNFARHDRLWLLSDKTKCSRHLGIGIEQFNMSIPEKTGSCSTCWEPKNEIKGAAFPDFAPAIVSVPRLLQILETNRLDMVSPSVVGSHNQYPVMRPELNLDALSSCTCGRKVSVIETQVVLYRVDAFEIFVSFVQTLSSAKSVRDDINFLTKCYWNYFKRTRHRDPELGIAYDMSALHVFKESLQSNLERGYRAFKRVMLLTKRAARLQESASKEHEFGQY